MTTGVNIDVETDAGSLEALAAGIAARSKALGRVTSDSIVAAGITILRSLKAMTKSAPVKAPDASYKVTCVSKGGAQFRGNPRRRRAVIGGTWDRGIRPVNLMFGLKGEGDVFKIELTNAAIVPRKSLNAPVYYVLAPNEDVARKYARARVERVLRKERGMARAALGMAQAKASTQTKSRLVTREEFAGKGGMSERAAGIAYDAGQIRMDETGYDSGRVSFDFLDKLNYSTAAAAKNALSQAVAKAANSMLGAYGSAELNAELQNFKNQNPEAKFVDIFRARMRSNYDK